jgi:hypothetical protein
MQRDMNIAAIGAVPPAAVYYWHRFIEVLPEFILVATAIHVVLGVALMVKKLRGK